MFGPRDLPLLTLFAAVVRLGSLTAAARALGLTKGAASLQLRALEQRCGVRLLERTTRRQHLTEIGTQVLAIAQRAAEMPDEVATASDPDRGMSFRHG
jgi:DNA-binding transcriptional LysR family regulator